MNPGRDPPTDEAGETPDGGFARIGPSVEDVEPRAIGAEARELDRELTVRERMRLSRSTLRRLALLCGLYVVTFLVMRTVDGGGPGGVVVPIYPVVVVAALVFELADSAAGMGFGTALAPLLFLLGYDPLQVAPVLLVSETLTGGISGGVHHELANVSFSLRPLNDTARVTLLLGVVGAVGAGASILLTYVVLPVPDAYIETYVSLLVVLMGVIGLLRARLAVTIRYRPRLLVAFALLAGVNKGIGGGGYGPVVTLGQVLSGVYEKSATAISSVAESVVSLVGVVTFAVLSARHVAVDLTLLPSIYTGGFVAAVGAPYLVRVVPNRVWRYVIPLYAFAIGVSGLTVGLEV